MTLADLRIPPNESQTTHLKRHHIFSRVQSNTRSVASESTELYDAWRAARRKCKKTAHRLRTDPYLTATATEGGTGVTTRKGMSFPALSGLEIFSFVKPDVKTFRRILQKNNSKPREVDPFQKNANQ